MDKLDVQILSILLDNCRESDRQIGKKIGISGGAVKTRIQKMQKNKIIEKFALRVEPPILGYNVFYIVITGQNQEDILEQVRLVGEPYLIVPCVGGITVCGIVVKENVEKKIELAKKLMKDVRVLSIFQAENIELETNFTKTDLEIIEKLVKNPRERIEDLAKSLKISSKTVTRALEKFEKNNAILFTLVYDPVKLSGYIPYAIIAGVENLEKMQDKLGKKFSKSFLQKPFLAKNQIVLFMYSDDIYNVDQLVQKVRETEGVLSADLFIPKKITFPTKWVTDAIKATKNSKKLHLVYQTH
ncbi:MAG: AsnC family transcriptional regulator [Nitrosopumilaceae archaeon]